MIIIWLLVPGSASPNAAIDLKPNLCLGAQPNGNVRPEQPRSLRCDPSWKDQANRWTWVQLDDPRRLDALPAGWHLLLPHRHLDALAVAITYRNGSVERLTRPDGALAVDWSPFGHARFVSSRPGADVAALSIGYRPNSASSPLQYAKAVPAQLFESYAANFNLVVGLFLGAVGSALVYNLFIGVGRRHSFQRIYIAWSILALLNGLLASGLLTGLWPALAGPAGILANKIVLAALFASATLFLLSLIEKDVLPRAVVRVGVAIAVATAVIGPMAAINAWLPFGLVGALTSVSWALNIALVPVVATIAARRGSRAIWFYLAGWTPILVFGMILIAYDAGMVAHSQLIDLGGLLGISFESVVLSLAIADRFRRLQREHDELERAQHVAQADKAALQKVADTDQLTGLSNRRAFDEALAAAKRGEIDQLALVLIDVDHFKRINDRFGHEAGDDLLTNVAQHLRASVRATDVVARLGGDEFAILLKGGEAQHVGRIIEELLAVQRQVPHSAAGEITFSVGAAAFPEDGDDPAQLYKNADLALYEAKRLGRAQSHRYSPVLRIRDQRRLARTRDHLTLACRR